METFSLGTSTIRIFSMNQIIVTKVTTPASDDSSKKVQTQLGRKKEEMELVDFFITSNLESDDKGGFTHFMTRWFTAHLPGPKLQGSLGHPYPYFQL